MNKYMIYLAGAISCYKEKENFENAVRWRLDTQNLLEDININGKVEFNFFDPTISFNNIEQDFLNPKSVVRQNCFYLEKSDFIVVNLKDIDKSIGTIYEMIYSSIYNIPVFTIGSCDWLEEKKPHLLDCITESFETMEQLVEYISIMYFI